MDREEYGVKISNGIYVGPVLFFLVSIGLTQVGAESGAGPVFGGLGVMIGAPAFAWSCFKHKLSHRYLVTGKHLRISTGMLGSFSKGEVEIPLASITGVAVRRGLIGQMFGYGHVAIDLKSGRNVYLKWLAEHEEFITCLRQ